MLTWWVGVRGVRELLKGVSSNKWGFGRSLLPLLRELRDGGEVCRTLCCACVGCAKSLTQISGCAGPGGKNEPYPARQLYLPVLLLFRLYLGQPIRARPPLGVRIAYSVPPLPSCRTEAI